MVVSKAFHYRWGDWLREDPILRGQTLEVLDGTDLGTSARFYRVMLVQ